MASFAERFGPWYGRGDVEDRRNEEFPWHQVATPSRIEGSVERQYTPTDDELRQRNAVANIPLPRPTPLGIAAGVNDVKSPTPDELIRFLISIDSHNKDLDEALRNPTGLPPIPGEALKRMNDPIRRK